MLASSFIEKLSFLSWGRQLPRAPVRWGFCVNYNIVISDLCSVLVFAPYYLLLSLLVLLVCANRLQVSGMNLIMGGQYVMYLKTKQNLLEQIFRVGWVRGWNMHGYYTVLPHVSECMITWFSILVFIQFENIICGFEVKFVKIVGFKII